MRFCPSCQLCMTRDTSAGHVVFQCSCGIEVDGAPEDARIAGAVLGAGETTEMYRRLIQTAAFDRVNQLVRRVCPDCGRDYMTQVRVGRDEVIVYTCKCGRIETGGVVTAAGSAAPPAAVLTLET